MSPPHRLDDRDNVAAEASAIVAIGNTLSTLDPETRLRVLHWVNERFNGSLAVEQPPTVASISARSADAMLSIEGVHAFFQPPVARQEASDTPHEPAHDDDVSDLFDAPIPRGRTEQHVVARTDAAPEVEEHGLSDLYEAQLTHAASEPLEPMADLFDHAAVVDADVDAAIAECYDEAIVEPAVEAAAREDQPLDTLVSDLASALRHLTLQLEDATA